MAALDRQLDRLVDQADAGDRAVDDQRPVAVPAGAMKPSPQGRLPKAPRLGELAGVGDRLPSGEVEPEVGAVRVR